MGADSFPNGGIGTLRFQGETNAKSPPDASSVTQVPGLVCGASLIPAMPRSSVSAGEPEPSRPTPTLRMGRSLKFKTLTNRILDWACAVMAASAARQTRLNKRKGGWILELPTVVLSGGDV